MFSHCTAAVLTQNAQTEWFSYRLGLQGVELVEDPQLKEPVAASRSAMTIWVPKGLAFVQKYRRACDALLFIKGGIEWAPKFVGVPDQPALATVLPFNRPGSQVGTWRR
jgi:hypothetical protein